MTLVIPAVAGALIAGGLLLLVQGLTPRPVQAPRPRRRATSRVRLSRRARVGLLAGGAAGVLVAVLTGWVVAVGIMPAVLVGLSALMSAPPAREELRRLEAMEEWLRSVSGVLTAGVGLEQALITSLRSTPEPIRPEISRLVGRLRSRWGTVPALRLLADDLDDPTADLIVANLVLGAQRRGPGLATVLEAVAQSVAEDVKGRREIEADRAKPRANVRLITGISVVVLGYLALTGEYVAAYGTPIGQIALIVLLTGYVLCLLWMRMMTRGKPLPRFIGSAVREQVPS